MLGHLTAEQPGIINEDLLPLANCQQLQDEGETKSGLYRVNPGDSGGEFTVFCDMSILEGGWVVIQRRVDDSTSFERNFKPYRNGFGDLNKNFWLGLNKIKRITDMGNFELYIGLENFYTAPFVTTAWSRYGAFSLGSEASNYKLTISQHNVSSTAGDSLASHNNHEFSAKDADNDSHSTEHCAQTYLGGWWYDHCHDSNLNGVWYEDGVLPTATEDGIMWESWFLGSPVSMRTSVMAVRPV